MSKSSGGRMGKSSSGGIALGIIAVGLIALKLFKAVDWSWGWVLSPILLSVLLGAAVEILGLIATLLAVLGAALSTRDN